MSHRFLVNIDHKDYSLGNWQKVSGLSVKWEACPFRAGDQGNALWIYPGLTKYENIKLTRPVSADSNKTQDWLTATSTKMTPMSGSIQLCGSDATVLVTWTIPQFFPVSWAISEFTADTGKVITETLELAHTGFLPDQVKANTPSVNQG